tara:strand:- start:655 stop:1104 length:450 start_codon:yes stop_codon:yes gene_type:complete
MKIKIKYKYSYILSILISLIVLLYFAYKGAIAYLIHKELYGGGIDVVISLRGTVAIIMLLLIILQIQFMRIKDLKSHRIILMGIFIVWSSIFFMILFTKPKEIYFLIMISTVSIFTFINILSLKEQIKEERNMLTEKEIYLLQKLAKKK